MRACLTGPAFTFQEGEDSPLSDVDPWFDLYLPAILGESAQVRAALADLGDADGTVLAVAARALEVLGMALEARRYAHRAMEKGGDEALALTTFLGSDGDALTVLRMRLAKEPGRRADAACDRAVLALRRGNTEVARRWVRLAQELCPDHCEAARWLRFLDETVSPTRTTRRYQRDHRVARATHGRDVAELFPERARGWLSVERLRRRVRNDGMIWHSSACALGRLQNAGVREYYFALRQELVVLPAGHRLATLELLADRLVSLAEEGRDGVGTAEQLLEQARRMDDTARADAAALIAGLSLGQPSLAPCARQGVADMERISRIRGVSPGGWPTHYWEAWLGWLDGSPRRARALLEGALEPVPWLLAMHTLQRAGDLAAVSTALGRAEMQAHLRSVTEGLRKGHPLGVPPMPRMQPRDAWQDGHDVPEGR